MKNLKKKLQTVLTASLVFMANTSLVFAADNPITSSKPFKAAVNITNDATTALLVLVPVVGTILYVYFNMRKGAADEMDHKMWDKRKNVVIFSTIGAFIASAVINVISDYFK